MIYRCPSCTGALEYNPELDMMECKFCGESYSIAELNRKPQTPQGTESYPKMRPGQNQQNLNRSMPSNAGPNGGFGAAPNAGPNRGFGVAPNAGSNGGFGAPPNAGRNGGFGAPPNAGSNGGFGAPPNVGSNDEPDIAPNGEPIRSLTESEIYGDIECNIYVCTACGAELAVNGVESSTFCAYCGQPTIVFDRVSSILRPEYIIPFTISKEQALTTLRNRFRKGAYVPDEIKNFKLEHIRGIYIPYWLFDMYYHDCMYLSGEVKSGKSTVTKYYLREAKCDFHQLTVDASRNLNDESSQRLEPYSMGGLKPFDIAYMSGFYADRYDQNRQDMQSVAARRAMLLFNDEVKKSIRASDIRILNSKPECNAKKATYCLLPAWFMTFRYEGEPYTMMVNGQTGKLVGTVPFVKSKIYVLFSIIAGLTILLTVPIFQGIIKVALKESEGAGKVLGFIVLGIVVTYSLAKNKLKQYRKNLELTKSQKTAKYVKERQDA